MPLAEWKSYGDIFWHFCLWPAVVREVCFSWEWHKARGGKGEGSARQEEECWALLWGLDSAVYFLTSTRCTGLQQWAEDSVGCQLTGISTMMQEETQGRRKPCFAFPWGGMVRRIIFWESEWEMSELKSVAGLVLKSNYVVICLRHLFQQLLLGLN